MEARRSASSADGLPASFVANPKRRGGHTDRSLCTGSLLQVQRLGQDGCVTSTQPRESAPSGITFPHIAIVRHTSAVVSYKESFLIKISEIQKPARGRKKERKIFFLIQSGVYVLGTGRRIKSVR